MKFKKVTPNQRCLRAFRFSMNKVLVILVLVSFAVILSAGVGFILQSNNPEGIRLYTPPTDSSGTLSNALYVGASLGLLLSAFSDVAGFTCTFVWPKLKHSVMPTASVPPKVAALIGGVVLIERHNRFVPLEPYLRSGAINLRPTFYRSSMFESRKSTGSD